MLSLKVDLELKLLPTDMMIFCSDLLGKRDNFLGAVYMSRASPDNWADLFDLDLTLALKLV